MKTDSRRLVLLMLRNNAGIYILHTFFFVLNSFIPFVPGLVARAFFDTLSGSQPAGLSALTLVSLFFVIGFSHSMLLLAAGPVDVYRAFLMVSTLRKNLLVRLLTLPSVTALRIPPGDVLNRVRDDVDEIEDFLSNVPDIAGNLLSTLAAVYILFRVNAQLTLFVLVPVVAIVLIARALGKRLEEYRRQAREASASVTQAVSEAFNSVQAIQIAGAEEFISRRIGRLNEQRRRASMKDLGLSVTLSAVDAGTASLGTGVVLLLAANQMAMKQFTVGDFTLFVSYLTGIAASSSYFGEWIARYRQTKVGFSRLGELLQGESPEILVRHASLSFTQDGPGRVDLERESPDLDGIREGEIILSAKSITASYAPASRGVKGATFEIAAGEFVVIAGRVGSGKTTLLRCLLGLLPLESGALYWRGREVDRPTEFFRPKVAAYARQAPVLFSATLAENIAGDSLDKTMLEATLRASTLDHDIDRMDHGIDTQVGPHGQRLSGGQLARVAAARALYRRPALLVFDDLSSSLDIETEREFWSRARSGNQAAYPQTCIVASNRQLVLRLADKILVMKDGEIVDSGSLESLLANSAEFRLLWFGQENV